MITADEQHVIRLLGSIGIEAEKIPESTDRTPDLIAHDAGHRYLIEVKTRTDDETVTPELLRSGSAYRVSPIAPTNTAGAIFRDAVRQLDSASVTDELKLIWLCVRSRRGAEDTLAEQARHTLYGISRVGGTGRGSKAPPCYFFHESVFFSYPQLNAVVIDISGRLLLCLNTYGEKLAELRKSRLASFFPTGLLDPVEREQAGLCLIADCAIDRKRSDLVLEYVSTKYGIEHAIHFNLDEHASMGVWPREQ